MDGIRLLLNPVKKPLVSYQVILKPVQDMLTGARLLYTVVRGLPYCTNSSHGDHLKYEPVFVKRQAGFSARHTQALYLSIHSPCYNCLGTIINIGGIF